MAGLRLLRMVGRRMKMRDLLIHDIRSPLAAIRGYAQLLERRARTSARDRHGLR